MWKYEPSHWPCLGIPLAHISYLFCNKTSGGNSIFWKSFCLIVASVCTCREIVQAGTFTATWRVERRSYCTSLQRDTNHSIVLFHKGKKCEWKGEVYSAFPFPQGYNRLWWKQHPIYKKNKKYLDKAIEKCGPVLIPSVLCYVVQKLKETLEQRNNVTAQCWNSWAPRYTCLWA